jgi:enoyl-CoA hydratase/carnithine racemase
MPDLIQVKKHAPSGTLIINRAEKRNALSRSAMRQLSQALEDLHQERSVRAVILTGAGTAFCAGADLQEIHETSQSEDAWGRWREDALQFKELLEQMLLFPKPIIAAVNGPALGHGAGLVLAADVTVAAAEAEFGLPEPRRGLVAGLVAPLLAFRIGGGPAANLLLTARTVAADEAHRLGIFHELTAGDLVWARAHAVAEEIAQSAAESLQLTKRMLNETIGEQLSTLLSAGAAASATAKTTEAAAEGCAAFVEKRFPEWP